MFVCLRPFSGISNRLEKALFRNTMDLRFWCFLPLPLTLYIQKYLYLEKGGLSIEEDKEITEDEGEKMEEECCKEWMEEQGMKWRVSLSIIMGVGWLVFLILWLAFYASDFNIYQNIAIVLSSILIVGAVLGASWASWGMKHGRKFKKKK